MIKKFCICFLVLLYISYPVSAAGITLNRWVLNVNILEDGTVEEIIQAEIESGTSSINGISFSIPSTKVSLPNITSFSAIGQSVELQKGTDATKVIINFDNPLEKGTKWNARIDFRAEDWAVRSGMDYSIVIPFDAPQAIVSGKNSDMSVAAEPEIRSQVFLPKSVAPDYVEPAVDQKSGKTAYNKLFQFNHIVLTWFRLNIGDVIRVKGTYSSDLGKIIETNEKMKDVSDRIKAREREGRDVSNAQTHLANARDYSNQAIEGFWKKEDILDSLNSANTELNMADSELSIKVEATATEAEKKTPAFEAPFLITILFTIVFLKTHLFHLLSDRVLSIARSH